MSQRKKPLSEAAPTRTQATDERSEVARRRVVVGILVGVVVLGAGAFLLTRDGGIAIPGITASDPETPQLAFARVKVVAQATTDTSPKDIDTASVGPDVEALVTTLYQGAWIDPGVWEGGDYADLFDETMTGEAPAEAENELEALTLGPDAGDVYELVAPGRSTLTVSVLAGPKDEPVQALAQVVFRAQAEHVDGTFTDIRQTASYFLQDVDGDWRIISFDASRVEDEGKAPTSTTPGAPTPTETST